MKIEWGKTEDDVREAIDISCRSFPLSFYDAKERINIRRQLFADEYKPENFIICREGKKITAALRVYPRTMRVGNSEFQVLGLADYCVDRENNRNPLLGIKFYKECVRMMSDLSYPIAMGSGRRVMGNYYYRFGHVGCDTYCRVKLEKLDQACVAKDHMIVLREFFDRDKIDSYEKFRRDSFSTEWSLVLRKSNFWYWIESRIYNKEFSFFEILDDDKCIGYCILQHDAIIDYGMEKSMFSSAIGSFISEVIKKTSAPNLSFHLSPKNRLFRSIGLSNVSYTMRYVPDEGIVALGLNRKLLVELFCDIASNCLKESNTKLKEVNFNTDLQFIVENESINPLFDPTKINVSNTQLLLNFIFQGTSGPFSMINFSGVNLIPASFNRMNDIDAM